MARPRGVTDRPTTEQAKKMAQYEFNRRPTSRLSVARLWLAQELREGPRLRVEVMEAAAQAGIASDVLEEAVAAVGVIEDEEAQTWALHDDQPQVVVTKEGSSVPIDERQQCADQFALSAEERRIYGLRPDEQHCWIRDPGYWTHHAPGDPARDHMRGVPGGRVIIHNGEFVTNGPDLILAAAPMDYVKRQRLNQQAAALDIEADNAGALKRDSFTVKANEDDERVRMLAEQNILQNRRAGLTGPMSPSSGQEYDDYVRHRGLSPADIRREEAQYALGRFYSADLTDEQIKAAVDTGIIPEAKETRGQQRGSSGKFISIPPNVRPRNIQDKRA